MSRESGKILQPVAVFVTRHPRLVVAAYLVAAILFGSLSVINLSIDTDLSRMIAEDLPFRRAEEELRKAFPKLQDTIVVVVEAETPERAVAAQRHLAARLRGTGMFASVLEPGGGAFFDRNGLLYLDPLRLQNLADDLAAVQPLLALLAEDISLRRLFSLLREVVEREGEVEIPEKRIDRLFGAMAAAVDEARPGRLRRLSWQEVLAGEPATEGGRRQFVIAAPILREEGILAAEAPLAALREEVARVEGEGVRLRLTGDIPLDRENLVAIGGNIGLATLASLLLASLSLVVAVHGSLRLAAANLAALITGFTLTLGFAVAAVGSLNLISVTFGVLYIGLGIDFSLLLSLRYREELGKGSGNGDAIRAAVAASGRGLFLCAAAAAIGFFSFIPTAYAGAADLGLISGVGMFINLLVTLTLLPALLSLVPAAGKGEAASVSCSRIRQVVTTFPYRHRNAVLIGAAVSAAVSAVLVPRLSFDYNPLNLHDQDAESVVTARELFSDPESSPWIISILVGNAGEAAEVAAELAKLEPVKQVVTLAGFIPVDQEEKLATIADVAFFFPPFPPDLRIRHQRPAAFLPELAAFRKSLAKRHLSGGERSSSARKLYEALGAVEKRLRKGDGKEEIVRVLEESLLGNLPPLLERLELSLQATEVTKADLPPEVVDQYVTADGRQRVQVFPREDISNAPDLERFVTAVQRVRPDATGPPVSIYEAGRAVVASFREASLYALAAITLFLLVELRSVRLTLLVLVPFGYAFLLTAASSVAFGIPLNFANIIILPLLLGLGIDNDIHLVHRHRTEPPESGNLLQTSTSRAVVFSTITNIVGFGTLSWMPHRGLASMGILLTLCMTYLILSTLFVLPALLARFGGGR